MSKFRIGDRVKITATPEQLRSVYINPAAVGQCGVVDYTDLGLGRLTTSVRLDDWDHSCWVEPEWLQLQLVAVTDEPREFRVGDRVKITATPGQLQYEGIDRASAEYAPGKLGTVVGLDYDIPRVRVDGDEAVSHDGAWYFKAEFLTLVAKFEVGDKVRIIATREQLKSACIGLSAFGMCGVVSRVVPGTDLSVQLDLGADEPSWNINPNWLQRVTVTDEPPCCADLPVQSQRLADAIALLKELDAFCQRFVALVPLSGFEVPDCTVHYLHQRLNEIIAQEVLKQ